ncbi:MAG: hypothetical protein QNJ54_30225 [Prochloraceae cyanobacterium]|nr:hypothetical protein [Prochloraceae cyanobacterium]
MGLIVFNYNLSLAQEQRELQAIDEWKNQKDPNADAYSAGESDAIIGAEPDPKLITNKYYWSGYQSKQFQYYCTKYGIELETEF